MLSRSWKLNFFLAGMSLPAALLLAATASAALIVNHTWQDGERSEQESGVDSDSDTNIESAWYRAAAVTDDGVGGKPPL